MYFRHRLKLRNTFKRSTQIFKSSLRNHISVGINALKTDITKADMIKEICIPLLLNVSSLESNYTVIPSAKNLIETSAVFKILSFNTIVQIRV